MNATRTHITFKERENSVKVQHALAEISRQILLFVLVHLFRGNLSDIKDSVERNLGSITRYNRAFSKEELELLKAGVYKTWNNPLLYKLIQNSCGLQYPINHDNINQEGETLEMLINRLKDWKDESARNFYLILTREQMEESLENLRNMCTKIVTGVSEKVNINESDLSKISQMVDYIIDDVKKAPPAVSRGTPQLIN